MCSVGYVQYNKKTQNIQISLLIISNTHTHKYMRVCMCISICVYESANVMRFDFSQLRPKSQQTNGLKKSQTSWDSPSNSSAAAVTTLDNRQERTPRALLNPRPTDQQGAYYKSLQSDPNRNRNAKKNRLPSAASAAACVLELITHACTHWCGRSQLAKCCRSKQTTPQWVEKDELNLLTRVK